MRRQTKQLLPVIIVAGLVLIGAGKGFFWGWGHTRSPSAKFSDVPASAQRMDGVTPGDLSALRGDIERLKKEKTNTQHTLTKLYAELAALRAQLVRFGNEQSRLSKNLTQLADKNAQTRDETTVTPMDKEEAVSEPRAPEETVERVEAQIQLLENTIRTESSDPAWSASVEQALQDAVDSEALSGLQLMDVSCHTTLCRLQLVQDGSLTPQASIHSLMRVIPWAGESFGRFGDEDPDTLVLYLAREGHMLPERVEEKAAQ